MRERGKCLGQFEDGVRVREHEREGFREESRGHGGSFIPSYIQLTWESPFSATETGDWRQEEGRKWGSPLGSWDWEKVRQGQEGHGGS